MFRIKLFLVTNLCLVSLNVSAQGFDVFELGIRDLQSALEDGTTTSVELVDLYLARIEAYDKQGPMLNSIVRINTRAREQAAVLDAERARSGARSLLHGIPVLIKDNYNTTDMPTTNGSVAFANFVPSHNATQVDKLLEAGAIIIAKTNLHEYARGITSIASLIGQTRNPYDIRRVPGGSSGGTGAAVAASFGAVGMGSDTCGSIRIPSAYNNLVGLRPSKGLSSIHGIMPLSHTQDTGGPLAKSVEDLAIVLDLTVGYDSNDEATAVMQSLPAPEFVDSLDSVQLEGLRFGKLTSYFENANGGVRSRIEDALEWYEEQGVEVIDIEIPNQSELLSASGVIGFEFKPDLNQYLASSGNPGVINVSEIVELSLYHEALEAMMISSAEQELNEQEYAEAIAARTTLQEAIEEIFAINELDALIYPTITQAPVMAGDPQPGTGCPLAANSGLPALSMPVGFAGNDLPVGMELLGKHFQDENLLAIAKHYEEANNPRMAPAVTPALENGAPPADQSLRSSFNRHGVSLVVDFKYSTVTNTLNYDVSLADDSTAEVYAVTLTIDSEEIEGLNEAIVLNLLGPDSSRASGEYFMSTDFRDAFREERVYLRVFADTIGVAGAVQIINQDN